MAPQKIDNFTAFENMLTFPGDSEFYYVFVINRSKDEGEDVFYDDTLPNVFDFAIYHSGWCISSYAELLEKKEEIVALCEEKNARAYITINPRTYQEVDEIAEKIRNKWGKGDFSFMYAAIFGDFFDYYKEGWVMNDDYLMWLQKHPRILIDVDIDSETGLKDISDFLHGSNIDIVAEVETVHGGRQFVTDNQEVVGLDFSMFDIYERVGRQYCDPDDQYTDPAVHCLEDTAVNLYANLKGKEEKETED